MMKKGTKLKTVQEKPCAKSECKKAAPQASTKESNLKKLAKSGKLETFVKKNNGLWNHQDWLVLCSDISLEGFEPIDFDQVGLLLEQYKAVYFSK